MAQEKMAAQVEAGSLEPKASDQIGDSSKAVVGGKPAPDIQEEKHQDQEVVAAPEPGEVEEAVKPAAQRSEVAGEDVTGNVANASMEAANAVEKAKPTKAAEPDGDEIDTEKKKGEDIQGQDAHDDSKSTTDHGQGGVDKSKTASDDSDSKKDTVSVESSSPGDASAQTRDAESVSGVKGESGQADAKSRLAKHETILPLSGNPQESEGATRAASEAEAQAQGEKVKAPSGGGRWTSRLGLGSMFSGRRRGSAGAAAASGTGSAVEQAKTAESAGDKGPASEATAKGVKAESGEKKQGWRSSMGSFIKRFLPGRGTDVGQADGATGDKAGEQAAIGPQTEGDEANSDMEADKDGASGGNKEKPTKTKESDPQKKNPAYPGSDEEDEAGDPAATPEETSSGQASEDTPPRPVDGVIEKSAEKEAGQDSNNKEGGCATCSKTKSSFLAKDEDATTTTTKNGGVPAVKTDLRGAPILKEGNHLRERQLGGQESSTPSGHTEHFLRGTNGPKNQKTSSTIKKRSDRKNIDSTGNKNYNNNNNNNNNNKQEVPPVELLLGFPAAAALFVVLFVLGTLAVLVYVKNDRRLSAYRQPRNADLDTATLQEQEEKPKTSKKRSGFMRWLCPSRTIVLADRVVADKVDADDTAHVEAYNEDLDHLELDYD
ncbi:unnamed protein product [Amoebophrya sp. A25]|nr:unnamed protein product [Amoebophrya sp. A25]|eukprot:GSA25T00016921001.1